MWAPLLVGPSRKGFLGAATGTQRNPPRCVCCPATRPAPADAAHLSRHRLLPSHMCARAGKPAGPQRDWATAAAVAACVGGGADIVRVHNVAAGRDAARVAEGIWRGSG